MMEFWLINNNASYRVIEPWIKDGNVIGEITVTKDLDKFQLPINPPQFEISSSSKIDTHFVEEIGEIPLQGYQGLKTIQISSFFPAEHYNFCLCKPFDDPYEYVKNINRWQFNKLKVRLVVTEADIDMLCIIESFSYGEKAGSRDIDFTLTLKEYKNNWIMEKLINKSAKEGYGNTSFTGADKIADWFN